MLLQWIFFIGSAIVTYIGISLFGQLTGGSTSTPWAAIVSVVRPVPLILLVISNMFFAVAVYFGLTITRYAIPIILATGAITGFVYSVAVLGGSISAIKLVGILCVVAGIVLLGM